ncbi:MAG: cysteine desulfurase-like protein [Actinomycetota bacterium]
MVYDVSKIRSHFPSLDTGIAYFDGPGGSQVPQVVAQAISSAISGPISNRGTITESEINAEEIVQEFRSAVADLIGVDARGVVYGRSWTQLTYDFSRTIAKTWNPGDEVVVSRLDHDSNIRPWIQAAASVGATVRWAEFDRKTGELPVDAVASILSDKTKLVAVTGAGNTIGTRPDIPAISEVVHKRGALLYVDGVHLSAHTGINVKDLGADFYGFSFYKLLGPHCSALAADPALLETLNNDKLLPSTNQVPERFEFGTLPYELMAGCTAAVNFVSNLVVSDLPTRREKILFSMHELEKYETALFEYLEAGLKSIQGLKTYGHALNRTPTTYFSIDGVESAEIYKHLAKEKVNAPASNFYALEVSRALGLGEGGAVRAGLAPYSTYEDVDRLVAGLKGYH